jgi:hypothetical protein
LFGKQFSCAKNIWQKEKKKENQIANATATAESYGAKLQTQKPKKDSHVATATTRKPQQVSDAPDGWAGYINQRKITEVETAPPNPPPKAEDASQRRNGRALPFSIHHPPIRRPPLMASAPAPGVVVVFDFDRTIIDWDSDNWVVTKLGAADAFKRLRPTMRWNPLMVTSPDDSI